MAITKMMNIKTQSNLYNAIAYIMREEKTEESLWIGGNAGDNPEEVYRVMMQTKQDWGKLNGRKGYHFVISWKPGECDPEKAYQVLQEFSQEYLGGEYDYVFAIHTDTDHCHGHIIFNSVNRVTGYKYRYERGDWERYIQPVTDKICLKYDLPRLRYEKEARKGMAYVQWKNGGKESFKNLIRTDIDYAVSHSTSYDEFLGSLKHFGYEIKTGITRQNGKEEEVLSLKLPGQKRAWRTKEKTLGKTYTVEAIRERIQNQKEIFVRPRCHKLKRWDRQESGSMSRMVRGISGYQKLHVRDVYQIQNRYARHNIYAVNQAQIRKNLLQIRKLKEDCRYLLSMQIRSRETLLEREKALVKEELYLKQKQRVQEHVAELESYQKVQQLEQELKQIPVWEDRFEEVLDELECLQKDLPEPMEDLEEIREKLAGIREEKRLIRQIKKIDAERKEQNLSIRHLPMPKEKAGIQKPEKRGKVWKK